MAHTTLDLSPRTTRRNDGNSNRSATFRRDNVPGEEPDLGTTARRAAYRPREEVAVRRDVVEDFRNRLERDATHTPDAPDAVAAALFGIARSEEALGRLDEAKAALERLGRMRDFSPAARALSRRIDRREDNADAVLASLRSARKDSEGPRATLLALEEFTHTWQEGAGAEPTAEALDALDATDGDFSTLWRARLMMDALLEQGDFARVVRCLEEGVDDLDSPELRDLLTARLAVWQSVWGDVSAATELLEQVRSRGHLDGDLGQLLGALYFEADDREAVYGLVDGVDSHRDLEVCEPMTAAMLEESVGRDPQRAEQLLSAHTDASPEDWTALRTRETHLERYLDRPDELSEAGSGLIDVFNQQLEGPLSTQERVTKLTRLGRLYECEAGLEEAAAEVYREALALQPDHVPALRALGRLYARRDNWAGLADLYEREIANMQGAPSVWRRHFQVAEIYRSRLDNAARALGHYRKVLEHRPHYLPALKAAAALLGQLDRWEELADLFLASVEVAPNRRQKLYLLDKVAEVAEDKLENYAVAIGAWQEILLLDNDHPRAFAALGRLYARTERWEDLIALNLSEMELVADDEEEAVLLQKCAEIAERHLADLERAEKFYRRALQTVPDFLPALEGLGRLYMRKERWDDIIEMSGRELQQTDDLREAVRRLGALAEIFETRLDRRDEAIRIYERILELAPADAHALESSIRLNYTLERWTRVVALLERKLAMTAEPHAYAALQGELGAIAEWHQGNLAQAFGRWLAALDAEPSNCHWLAGVSRTWAQSEMSAAEVADRLEDNVMKPMDGEVRDRYFKVIARLRERDQQTADASRAYRMHGSSESLENQFVLQLAMGQGGERDVLRQFRRANAQHPVERLLDINRTGPTVGDVEALRTALPALGAHERAALLAELDLPVAAEFVGEDEPAALRLSAELVRVLEGEALHGDLADDTDDPMALRLRGIEARQSGDFEGYVWWTRRELELVTNPDLRVSRLTEIAAHAASKAKRDELASFLEEAARTAFPTLADAEQPGEGAHDGPILDALYHEIREAEQWDLLRRCLEAHAGRQDLTRSRRLYLFRTLAGVLEDHIEDFAAASKALSHCWQLSEDPDYLRQLVRVSRRREDIDRAIRFQQRHFEFVTNLAEPSAHDCVRSGLWLAELLLEAPERLEDGIDCLEHLLATYQDVELLESVRRQLAYAYFELGNAYRAVELFQEVLGETVEADELDDWRKLVDVYRSQLDDLATAYELQWKLVASGHAEQRDLDELIELGFDGECLEDCAERLEKLAESARGDWRVTLIERAAQVVDEDLMWPEEAVRLYTEALELCEGKGEHWLELTRRRAFALSQIVGREGKALEQFRKLVEVEPFEPTTYRGLSDLLSRSQAFDRSRVARQILGVLNCEVEINEPRTKTEPSRPISNAQIAEHLLPDELQGGVLDVLQAAMPLVDKVWTDELPQRKALEGIRLKKLDASEAKQTIQAALEAFGFTRFKAESGDSGPTTPQVFAGSTPYMWLNWDQLDAMSSAELRFVAGYCSALAWCGLPSLLAIDGRRVWHLIEAVQLKQTGRGFGEMVDQTTQQLVDGISSPFHAVTRRRLAAALEPVVEQFDDIHCERWPRAVEQFACRVGLVLAGDIRAAVSGLLRFHGWDLGLDAPETQKQIRRNDEVRSLMAFAMSDDYLEARYALGLSGRPSQVTV